MFAPDSKNEYSTLDPEDEEFFKKMFEEIDARERALRDSKSPPPPLTPEQLAEFMAALDDGDSDHPQDDSLPKSTPAKDDSLPKTEPAKDGNLPKATSPEDDSLPKATASEDDSLPKGASKDDSLPKKIRCPSPYRDAQFVRDLEALFASASAPKTAGSSVYSAPSPPTLSTSSASSTPSTGSMPSATSSPTTTSSPSLPLAKSAGAGAASPLFLTTPPSLTGSISPAGRPSTKMKPWWRDQYLAAPARSYRVPAPWRDTSDQLQVLYRHLAIKEFGPVHSFSLNLKPKIEALARKQPDPAVWLHDRIARRLKQQFGRVPEFHLVIEEAEQHRLHVHGEIQIADKDAPAARKALRKAGGEWEKVRQHQAHTDTDPDCGWASYLAKDIWRVGYSRNFLPKFRRSGTKLSSFAITFKGNPITATKGLKARAAALYEEHREVVTTLRDGA